MKIIFESEDKDKKDRTIIELEGEEEIVLIVGPFISGFVKEVVSCVQHYLKPLPAEIEVDPVPLVLNPRNSEGETL
ncbi:hypothetical protein ACFLWH_01355 [Chloroflexota bacterium]